MTLPNLRGYTVKRDEQIGVANNNNNLEKRRTEQSPTTMNISLPMSGGGWDEPSTELPYFHSIDDGIQARKEYVRRHSLFSTMVAVLKYCKKEGLLGFTKTPHYECESDFSLDKFLESKGLNLNPSLNMDAKQAEYIYKLNELKQRYRDELEKLERVCKEFCNRMRNLLHEQAKYRPVTQQEIDGKELAIKEKFDFVKSQLRKNVCSAILGYYNGSYY